MNLALTDAEVAALCRALDNYLAMLTSEAARSEDREVEIDLWQLRGTLERLRQRLSTTPADIPGHTQTP